MRLKGVLLIVFLNIHIFAFSFSFLGIKNNKKDNRMPFGIISIKQPGEKVIEKLGEESIDFFNEFSQTVYNIYNNGIIQISSKYKVPVKITDILYNYNGKDVTLIPNYENDMQVEAILDFYSKLNIKGVKLLKELSQKNEVIAIAFGYMNNLQVLHAIKTGKLKIMISIYLYQNNIRVFQTCTINVQNLDTEEPYYDPEEMVSIIEKNVLKAYSKAILTIKQSGGTLDDITETKEVKDDTKTVKNNNNKYPNNKQINKNNESESDDDW